jgi:hypothetical protein
LEEAPRLAYHLPMKEPAETEPKQQQPEPAPRDAIRRPPEVGGPKGPEPTRYGDWEQGGRCTDF